MMTKVLLSKAKNMEMILGLILIGSLKAGELRDRLLQADNDPMENALIAMEYDALRAKLSTSAEYVANIAERLSGKNLSWRDRWALLATRMIIFAQNNGCYEGLQVQDDQLRFHDEEAETLWALKFGAS